jgi:hypothetical protein
MRFQTARKSAVASKGVKKVVATKVAKTTVKHKRPAKRGAVALRCVVIVSHAATIRSGTGRCSEMQVLTLCVDHLQEHSILQHAYLLFDLPR